MFHLKIDDVMPVARLLAFSLPMLLVISCGPDPVSSNVGSGTVLKATVNGQPYSFPLNAVSPPTYNVGTRTGSFTGVLTGNPSRSVSVSFTYDIDNSALPITLGNPDVSIIYTEVSGSNSSSFSCPIGVSGCSVTLSATDKTIVDGTFNANLADPSDTTRRVSITAGSFSVKLNR